jgi:hypothetical protein
MYRLQKIVYNIPRLENRLDQIKLSKKFATKIINLDFRFLGGHGRPV